MYLTSECDTSPLCFGRMEAAVPIPAQQITPLRGHWVVSHHLMVAAMADWREGVEETSVWVKRVRVESWRDEG